MITNNNSKKVGIYFIIISAILVVVLLFKESYAIEQNIIVDYERTENNLKLLIKSDSTDDIYGVMGTFKYQKNQLSLSGCSNGSSSQVETKNDIFLVYNPIPTSNQVLMVCNFKIVNNTEKIVLNINDINVGTGGDNKNVLTSSVPGKTIIINKSDINISTNSKTADNYMYILIALLVSLGTIIYLYKKPKAINILLLILSLFAFTSKVSAKKINSVDIDKNIDKNTINSIKSILLKESTSNSNYDLDGDNKITLSDYIIANISNDMPKVTFNKATETKATNATYSTKTTSNITYNSNVPIKKLSYCLTTNNTCDPNKDVTLNNEKTINISYPNSVSSQKVCIKATNNYNFNTIKCDSNMYYVNSTKPTISPKNSTVNTDNSSYELTQNINSDCGGLSCSVQCDKVTLVSGNNTINCSVTSPNGYNANTSYILKYTPKTVIPADAIENLAAFSASEVGYSASADSIKSYWGGWLFESATFMNNYGENLTTVTGVNKDTPITTTSLCTVFSAKWGAYIYSPIYCNYTFSKLAANRGASTAQQKDAMLKAAELVLTREFTIPKNVIYAKGNDNNQNDQGVIYQTNINGYVQKFSTGNNNGFASTDVYGNPVSTDPTWYANRVDELYSQYKK